jgi:glycine/D-amino acid oxidase-like deaminating enzyme
VRVCIVGGGLAGTLLAWRLVSAEPGWRVELVAGSTRHDATAASGGAVRAYETRPDQRQLAIDSLAELLTSPTLRRWSGFRRVDSVYLRTGDAGGLAAAAAEIEARLPGSARIVTLPELARRGWAGLAGLSGGAALLERAAGYTSPGRFRDAVLAATRLSIVDGTVTAIAVSGPAVGYELGGRRYEVDRLVVAAGAWTAALLRRSGLPADGYRTKSIQYTVYQTGGWRPPMFVDESTGLFGRPAGRNRLLLGQPSDEWDVDPDRPPTTPALHDSAAALARARFPALRLGTVRRRVGSADCYLNPPTLCLRPVLDDDHRLLTFSGGSGGSVKTALAASARAATQLIQPSTPIGRTSVGGRRGQP